MKAMLMTVMFFTYTGSGGTDLSGNKRTTNQSSDQKLERTSSPSGQKLSKHAMRGSAIFKVVKCYPEKGPSGLIVWRYLLRRQGCRFACSLDRGGQEKDGRRRVPLWFLKQARVGKIWWRRTSWMPNIWEQAKNRGVFNKKELTGDVEDIFCCIIWQVGSSILTVFLFITYLCSGHSFPACNYPPCFCNLCLSCMKGSFSAVLGYSTAPAAGSTWGRTIWHPSQEAINSKKYWVWMPFSQDLKLVVKS